MIVEVTPDVAEPALTDLCLRLARHEDVTAWPLRLAGRQFVVISGDEALVPDDGESLVVGRHSTSSPGYWLVDRVNDVVPRTVSVGGTPVGDGGIWCAAGPCALESLDDAIATGVSVREQGAHALRIGVFKPRTSPYNFQGKERSGIKLLPELKTAVGLPIVTEVLDPRDVADLGDVADCLQVGTRNMTNQALLKELGGAGRPVLLKRGAHSTVEEWLKAAEFVVAHGNPNVILCARGIASFDTSLRFTPDLGALLALRRRTSLPVVFDPSHTAGRGDAVARVALAAAVFAVDGLLIESHVAPDRMHRPGDGGQAYRPADLAALLRACDAVRSVAIGLAGAVR